MRINSGSCLLLYALTIIGCQPTAPTDHSQELIVKFFNLEIGSSWDYAVSYFKSNMSGGDVISALKTIKLVSIETQFDTTIYNFS